MRKPLFNIIDNAFSKLLIAFPNGWYKSIQTSEENEWDGIILTDGSRLEINYSKDEIGIYIDTPGFGTIFDETIYKTDSSRKKRKVIARLLYKMKTLQQETSMVKTIEKSLPTMRLF